MSGAFNCVKYGVPKIGLQCADQNFATKSVHVWVYIKISQYFQLYFM